MYPDREELNFNNKYFLRVLYQRDAGIGQWKINQAPSNFHYLFVQLLYSFFIDGLSLEVSFDWKA